MTIGRSVFASFVLLAFQQVAVCYEIVIADGAPPRDAMLLQMPEFPSPLHEIVIAFPFGSHVFTNECELHQTYGAPRILVNEQNHTISLFDESQRPPQCPQIFAPVYVASASFGPRAPGEWTIEEIPHTFTVYSPLENHWVGPNGDWDWGGYWTAGTPPTSEQDVFIDPSIGVAVTGPSRPRSIWSLFVGAESSGVASLVLQPDGPLTVEASVTISPAGRLAGSGVIHAGGGVNNQGEIHLLGTVDTPDDPAKPVINNGNITGNSLAEPVTLTGYVKGVGTLDNVNITGTDAPGFGAAAAVNRGSVSYNGTLQIQIGGTTPGNGHDQLNHILGAGIAELGGQLDVLLTGGFSPSTAGI